MFGLPSLQKLLLLAAVLAAVWYGFKFLGRLKNARDAEAKLRESGGQAQPEKGGRKIDAEETVECRVCGAYVAAAGGGRCDRPDCPF